VGYFWRVFPLYEFWGGELVRIGVEIRKRGRFFGSDEVIAVNRPIEKDHTPEETVADLAEIAYEKWRTSLGVMRVMGDYPPKKIETEEDKDGGVRAET